MNVYLLRLIAALTYNRFKNKNMKKIFNLKNFLMASVLLLVTVPANADTSPETKSRVKNSTQKSISDYFRVPGFILPVQTLKKDSAEKVKVLFTTDSAGRVNFAIAQSTNERLKREVEKRFSGLILKGLPQNVVHGVTLSFMLQ